MIFAIFLKMPIPIMRIFVKIFENHMQGKFVKIREFTSYYFCDFPFENERLKNSAQLNWGASFQWSFGPLSALGIIATKFVAILPNIATNGRHNLAI